MAFLTTFSWISAIPPAFSILIDEAFDIHLIFTVPGLGKDLASTFSFLRPNDLVWNTWWATTSRAGTPPPFDLLYWNSGYSPICRVRCTPGAPQQREQPRQAGCLHGRRAKRSICGADLPVYIYELAREDPHRAIGGAYASTQHLTGPKRFRHGRFEISPV